MKSWTKIRRARASDLDVMGWGKEYDKREMAGPWFRQMMGLTISAPRVSQLRATVPVAG